MKKRVRIQGIYLIVNIVDAKFYVGSSMDILRRFRDHRSYLDRNAHTNYRLQKSWNKFGSSKFLFLILKKVKNLNLLLRWEQIYINIYQSWDTSFGYNLVRYVTGVSYTTRTKKVLQYDLNGNFVRLWESSRQITDTLKFDSASIQACCRGFSSISEDFQWRYFEPNFSMSIGQPRVNSRDRQIDQYDLKGNFIKTWSGAYLVEKVLGISRKSVTTNCLGKAMTGCGYIWKYH